MHVCNLFFLPRIFFASAIKSSSGTPQLFLLQALLCVRSLHFHKKLHTHNFLHFFLFSFILSQRQKDAASIFCVCLLCASERASAPSVSSRNQKLPSAAPQRHHFSADLWLGWWDLLFYISRAHSSGKAIDQHVRIVYEKWIWILGRRRQHHWHRRLTHQQRSVFRWCE